MWHAGTITGEMNYCEVGSKSWQRLKTIAKQLDWKPWSRRGIWTLVGVITILLTVAGISAAIFFRKTAPLSAVLTTPHLSPKFQQSLSEFLREATRLTLLTSQGITHDAFGEQLATTRTAFELSTPLWPDDYAQESKHEFGKAIHGWKLLLQLWRESIAKGIDYPSIPAEIQMYYYPEGIKVLESYAPRRIIYGDIDGSADHAKYIRFKPNIRVLMTVAAEHFRSGQMLLEGNALGK